MLNSKNSIPTNNYLIHQVRCIKIERNEIEKEEAKIDNYPELVDCEKCNKKVTVAEFDFHTCICEYCDEVFLYLDVIEHMDACGNRTEFCERCNGYILKKNYKLHIQINNCQRPDRPKKNLFELKQEVRKYIRKK